MVRAVEKRLRTLLQLPGGGGQASRVTLYRDVLLVQLAMRVGASLRGVYDDQDNLRTEEIARRIRQAAAEAAQVSRRRPRRHAPRRTSRLARPGWIVASLLMLCVATVTAVSAVAIHIGLLPGL